MEKEKEKSPLQKIKINNKRRKKEIDSMDQPEPVFRFIVELRSRGL